MKKISILAVTGVLSSLLCLEAEDAKVIYERDCAKCHGAEGKGDTKMGKKLEAKDWSDGKVQEKLKDEEMIKVIKEGKKDGEKTKMKGYADTISDGDTKELVKLIRAMKK